MVKKTPLTVRSVLIAVILTGLVVKADMTQAEINPPTWAFDTDAPVATMKTVQQVEPRTPIESIPITITEPGSYYLTGDLTIDTVNADGIIINSNNVSIDLNGYGLYGNSTLSEDDGIVVLGTQHHIIIYNGIVSGWDGDGINALNADNSIFENLMVSNNGGDGIVTDFGCIIINCTTSYNGLDGQEGDDGTIIKNGTSYENEDNGFQTSEGCLALDLVSYKNLTDGVDVAAGSIVSRCVTKENGVFGVDLAIGGSVVASTASYNGWDNISSSITSANGFDIFSACICRDNIASNNYANGFRTFANAYLVNNKSHDNGYCGFRLSSTDIHFEGNQANNNSGEGIYATSGGGIFLKNRSWSNTDHPDTDEMSASPSENIAIVSTSSYGPVITLGEGDMNGTTGSDHPQANFEY